MQTNILITGASRGIGAAIAEALASDTTRIVALSSADGDLSDPATPARLWQASLGKPAGRFDVLVNNAGVLDRTSVVSGKGVSVRVDLGGCRVMNTKTSRLHNNNY